MMSGFTKSCTELCYGLITVYCVNLPKWFGFLNISQCSEVLCICCRQPFGFCVLVHVTRLYHKAFIQREFNNDFVCSSTFLLYCFFF